MNAEEARKLTAQNTERQEEIKKRIKRGEEQTDGHVKKAEEKQILMQDM